MDPETGKLLTSRPTAFGKYLNTKVGRATSMRTLDRVCLCICFAVRVDAHAHALVPLMCTVRMLPVHKDTLHTNTHTHTPCSS